MRRSARPPGPPPGWRGVPVQARRTPRPPRRHPPPRTRPVVGIVASLASARKGPPDCSGSGRASPTLTRTSRRRSGRWCRIWPVNKLDAALNYIIVTLFQNEPGGLRVAVGALGWFLDSIWQVRSFTVVDEDLGGFFEAVLPNLNERQRRAGK